MSRSSGVITWTDTNIRVFAPQELGANTAGIVEVVVGNLDMSDLASVRTFAKEVLNAEKVIHVLVGVDVAARKEENRADIFISET